MDTSENIRKLEKNITKLEKPCVAVILPPFGKWTKL